MIVTIMVKRGLSDAQMDMAYDSAMGRKSSKRTKYTARVGAGVRAMKKAASLAVKRALSRSEEVKTYTYATSGVIGNAGTSIANVYTLGIGSFPLSPYSSYVSIAQGAADAQRIGNKVKTKKCMLDLLVNPAPYHATLNPTPNPCILKIWIYRLKQVGNSTEVNNAISGYFKQSNTSDQALNGTYADLLLKDNTDAIQILHTSEHKIGFAVVGGTGAQGGYQSKTNNDFLMCKHIKKDITKYLYGAYEYNDNDQTPQNQSPTWLTMEMIPYDGTILNCGTAPGEFKLAINYDYTDA